MCIQSTCIQAAVCALVMCSTFKIKPAAVHQSRATIVILVGVYVYSWSGIFYVNFNGYFHFQDNGHYSDYKCTLLMCAQCM